MNSPLCSFLILWAIGQGLPAATIAPAAECDLCLVSLDIPRDGLWQGVRKDNVTTFALQRGDELFATVEVVKFYNEARYSLDQMAAHYRELCNPDIVIEGAFVSRTINGIPVRWGRGRGRAEDGNEFLVQLVFFAVGEDPCYLTTVVRMSSKSLHENLMPEIIQSLRKLPEPPEE